MESPTDVQNVVVRPFGLDDHRDVAALHRKIFPETPSAQLGKRYCRQLYQAYASEADAFGFVLWRGTERVGFVVGGTNDIHEIITRQLRSTAAVSLLSHPKLLISYFGKLRALITPKRKAAGKNSVSTKPSIEKTSKLFLIGIDETARGSGGAGSLMNSFMTRAFELGFDKVLLIVHRDNLRARAAYEKSGWVLNDKGGEAVEYYITASSITNVS
jgi:ribosomal protein S18 acetylase RimI-like enzyme